MSRRVPGDLDPVKLAPLLAGPAGALVVMSVWIVSLMRELSTMRAERDKYIGKYDHERERAEEFRVLAGDAVRAGKRSAQTAIAVARDRPEDDDDVVSVRRRRR